MATITFVNPLKPGKLNAYKAFMAEFTGPRKVEYLDLLQRYGLTTSKVHYHKIGNQEFVIVAHEQEPGKENLLTHWMESQHPFDLWFKDQLAQLHDFEFAGVPDLILDFKV